MTLRYQGSVMSFRSLAAILLFALSMFAKNLLAQPASFTATASFATPAVIGSGANTVTASFVPLGRQTLNPTASTFDFGRFI